MGEQTDVCRRLHSRALRPWRLHHFDRDFWQFLNRYEILAAAGPAEASRLKALDCRACSGLERAFEATYGEYVEACQSASYRFCTKFAAHKRVDMERARYELEEHGIECVSAFGLADVVPSPSNRDSIDNTIDRADAETAELVQLA